jgi:hypothetical protein
VTEKLDGQSATYFMISNQKKGLFQPKWLFGVCSRNYQLLKPDNSSYWFIAKKYSIKERMLRYCKRYNTGLVIQGEIIGPKIQGNKYALSEPMFYVFNIVLHKNGRIKVLDQQEQTTEASVELCLNTVPVISHDLVLFPTMEEMVKYSTATSALHNIPREGVVVRNYDSNISFKIINPNFLLKYDN